MHHSIIGTEIDFVKKANIILSWYLWNHAKYVPASIYGDLND